MREEGEGRAPGAGEEISPQAVVQTMTRQTVTLQPMDFHGGAELHLQPVESSTLEQDPGRSCRIWKGVRAGEDLLAGNLAIGGPMLEQIAPERHPTERTHCGEVCEGL